MLQIGLADDRPRGPVQDAGSANLFAVVHALDRQYLLDRPGIVACMAGHGGRGSTTQNRQPSRRIKSTKSMHSTPRAPHTSGM